MNNQKIIRNVTNNFFSKLEKITVSDSKLNN